MIMKYMHLSNLHVGTTQLIFLTRQQYWILGVRNIARRIVHNCITCFKLRKATQTQMMSDLPVERVRFQRPFSKVGCDYAGPFLRKVEIGRVPRKVKCYIALFVCFTTKAIHIELAGDLTTESFIGALDRFISRRGKPLEIWSDNATNFIGAKRKLDEMQQSIETNYKDINTAEFLSKNGITWRFIPPSLPHFGGLWESGVKSIKTHLKRVIGQTALTYERFYTLLTRIEALLNSRPLCPSNDGEIDALTPAHFLIGQPLTARTEVPVDSTINTDPLKQWDK
ncbi:uncharacterized protein LOC118756372, partial [Rhagoletis pomonella]|uniref:uncharacterized protein LOC118756372 n=1 Tax=Rhagoletis pomonella TaxID=28610 RepID=UPI001781BE89